MVITLPKKDEQVEIVRQRGKTIVVGHVSRTLEIDTTRNAFYTTVFINGHGFDLWITKHFSTTSYSAVRWQLADMDSPLSIKVPSEPLV